MEKVQMYINEKPKSYTIYIDHDIIDKIVDGICEKRYGNRYIIITDSNVGNIYGQKLLKMLQNKKQNVELLEFPAGEANKNNATKQYLDEALISHKLDRKSCIIALGGGVVGDLAGFVAATYMRGISFIQIPTTVIAQVDSSIGGKTAIDMPQGKNLIGAFYQPQAVYIDIKLLDTLDERNFINGIAEIIKYAIIRDPEFFDFLQKNSEAILSRKGAEYERLMLELIRKSCVIKKEVVIKDETESNLRKILNYGHTIGHGVEMMSNYDLLHGEAVAIGMVYEAWFSHKLGYLARMDFDRIVELIKKFKLPCYFEVEDIDRLINIMVMDKKNCDNEIEFVLIEEIGRVKAFEDGRLTRKIERDLIVGMMGELEE
ncbi:MAG: 3-dehydroquinate synthase [Clostridiales bacterium GWE2_32_10]|nr:MAG: 3-dehydroquinate synthase [Clostridiales bacterium GWE2_32_10]HBY19844.1 3-dehydroquinate synthase [Clostridiales bacterium]